MTALVVVRALAAEEVAAAGARLPLHRLDHANGFYLVAWDGAEPIGHAHLALADPAELQDVFVVQARRRRGVAAKLTRAAEAEIARRGHRRLRLTVSVGNEPAQRLYPRVGYVDAGLPPKRVRGTIRLRGEPLDVDDTLLTLEKRLRPTVDFRGERASSS